jgi:xylulokinase
MANEPQVMARVDLVGHLNTFLHRRMTGARVIDPSNASFTGLYLTCQLSGWSDELCAAVGISPAALPQVVEANRIAGRVTTSAAAQFGVKSGTPVITGMVDTSAAMLITGAADGQLFHNCGSTDVLARAADRPTPHERLLTRGLGIGRKWISAATIAAAGSSLDWVKAQFFTDFAKEKFFALVGELAAAGHETSVRFEPYLAGERASIDQKQAAFSGLTLATRREDMLLAVMQALSIASGQRVELFAQVLGDSLPDVYVTGGGNVLGDLMHRHWPAQWKYHQVTEAALRGLALKGYEI